MNVLSVVASRMRRPRSVPRDRARRLPLATAAAVVAVVMVATGAGSAGATGAEAAVGGVAAAALGSAGAPVWFAGPSGSPDFEHSATLAYEFLDQRVDTYGTGDELRLARSYQGGYFDTLPGGFVSSFVYDDALAVMAYLARGLPADEQRAKALGSALLFVQANDPTGDGRTRASYQPDSLEAGVVEIGSASAFTGNQAWVGMALARLYDATGEQRFLDGALAAGEWIQTNTLDTTRAPFGYTGGQDGDGNAFTFKATEHNIDVTAFFAQLATLTGDPVWSERSAIAAGFVASMQAEDGHLWTGTNTDGTSTNYYPIPEDPQAWSYLATLDERYSSSLTWTVDNLNAVDGPYEGPAFSNADVSKVWFEGSGQLGLALRARNADGDAAYVNTILSSAERAQREAANGDGKGIVAASSDGLDTGFGDLYYSSLHTGATAWYLLAVTGFNPFRLDDATPATPVPATIEVTGGNAQSQTARQPFDAPLRVVVRDAQGAPVAGQNVVFAVTTGSASLVGPEAATTTTVVTDADGTAGVAATAGAKAGAVTVTASVGDAPATLVVTFTETVLAPAKARADISVSIAGLPSSLTKGESATVTITVRNAGPQAASVVRTSVVLGSAVTVTSAPDGTVGPRGSTATWSAPGLAAGAAVSYQAVVTAGARHGLTIFTAATASTVPDPRLLSNLLAVPVRVR